MRSLLILFAFFLISSACKEGVTESVKILIQNKTETTLVLRVFPKVEYQRGNLYRHSDNGGGFVDTEFSLSPKRGDYFEWDEVLFSSADISIDPHALMESVFDSITVSTLKNDTIIRFTQEKAIGYSQNIFSENAAWNYELIEDELPVMGSRNLQKYHCYKFVILEDEIVISTALE